MDLRKEIKNRIKQLFSKGQMEFDYGSYSEVAGSSCIYTDVLTARLYSIPLICAGLNGVYVFITTYERNPRRLRQIYSDISDLFSFTSGVFTFIRTPEKDYFVSGNDLVEISQMLDKFENLYKNTEMPVNIEFYPFDSDLDMMMKPYDETQPEQLSGYTVAQVSRSYLREFDKKIETIKESEESNRKVMYRNGIKYVKHPILKFGMIVSEGFFPVSDEDPWRFLLLTVFGGVFGFHHFKTGEIAKGIGYIMSCGCFGAGYLVDIFSVLTGTYHVERDMYHDEEGGFRHEKLRIYLDELTRRQKKYGYILFGIGIFLLYVAFKLVYLPLLNRIGLTLLNTVW